MSNPPPNLAAVDANAGLASNMPSSVGSVAPRSSGRSIDTTLLLFLAVWLIFNSHLESFYPLSWLAADGLLGNLMFFVISGYGIQRSLSQSHNSFLPYCKKRLLRLYPTVWIVLVLFGVVLRNAVSGFGVADYLEYFVWPTPFTYVHNILPFYIALWFICGRRNSVRLISIAIGLGVACYAGIVWLDARTIAPGTRLSLGMRPESVSWCIYWIATAAGALAGAIDLRPRLSAARVCVILGLVLSYFALKVLMVVKGIASPFYFGLHVQSLAICLLALATLSTPTFVKRVTQTPLVGLFVRRSALLSLEIYVIHSCLLGMSWFTSIRFPLNILVLAVLTFALSEVVGLIARTIRNRFGVGRE
jgi:peptidoglycan/LPS O-acetylase OafA/YrhL